MVIKEKIMIQFHGEDLSLGQALDKLLVLETTFSSIQDLADKSYLYTQLKEKLAEV